MATILIIEDEAGPMKFLRKVVTRMGHEPVCAENGADGQSQAASVEPAVILTDLSMPGRPRGIELLRALRETCQETPIVIISGYPSEEVMQECTHLSIAEFLTKPFEVAFVQDVIKQLLPDPADPIVFD